MCKLKRASLIAATMFCLIGTSLAALPDHYWIVGGYWSDYDDAFHISTMYNRTDVVVMKARYEEDGGYYFWNDSSTSELRKITPHPRDADVKIEMGDFKYYLNRQWNTGSFHQVVYLQGSDFIVFDAMFYEDSLYSTGVLTSIGTELSLVFDIFEQLGLEEFISEHELETKIRHLYGMLSQYFDAR